MDYSTVIELAKIFATPIVAAIVTFTFGKMQLRIAKAQADTAKQAKDIAHDKLRLDLLERRMKVYDAVIKFIRTTQAERRVNMSDVIDLTRDVQVAKWLFEPEIYKFLDTYYTTARLAAVSFFNVKEFDVQKEITLSTEQQLEQEKFLTWLLAQQPVFEALLKPYLHFSQRS
jgi:hypothetical protein